MGRAPPEDVCHFNVTTVLNTGVTGRLTRHIGHGPGQVDTGHFGATACQFNAVTPGSAAGIEYFLAGHFGAPVEGQFEALVNNATEQPIHTALQNPLVGAIDGVESGCFAIEVSAYRLGGGG